MLNHIWLSLIAVAILVAVGKDVNDEVRNTYRNGIPLPVRINIRRTPSPQQQAFEGEIEISAERFGQFYDLKPTQGDVRQPISFTLISGREGSFYFSMADGTPPSWREMGRAASSKDRLTGRIFDVEFNPDRTLAKGQLAFEPIHFVKMKAVTQAALDFANTAVEISLGLIGIMALWLGLIKIAEEAGLVRLLTRVLTPLTRRIFPDVPADHPAVGAMIMNIAANMLGLSNAATPIGLKAMEELNKLNPKTGTATNAMVTFLAINTGGLILIPATAIAVRAAAGSSNPGIIIGTSIFGAGCATIAGVVASRLLQRLPRYRKDIEIKLVAPPETRHE